MPIRDNMVDLRFDFEKAKLAFGMQAGAVVKVVVFELLRRIVIKTPVDTGRAAGSWMVRGGSTDNFVLPESSQMSRDEAAAAAMARVSKIDFTNLENVYWIYNNLPYIESLEYGLYPDPVKRGSYVTGVGYVIKTVAGYSKQAPAGMVRLSIAEVEVDIATIARQANIQ